MDTPLRIEYAEKSDVGMRRATNQDSITSVFAKDATKWHQRGHLLVVADGMGAHAAGELASKLAVDNIPQAYYKQTHPSSAMALRQAVRDANSTIYAKGSENIDFQGMGTTCTCLAILPQGALIAHVGDSRAYRLRGDTLEQLSFDHSLIWEAVAAGHGLEENLITVLPKNVITRSLGPHETVNIDLEGAFEVKQGDTFLLCSDGLSGQVTDLEMGTLLGCMSPAEAAQTFVDLANLRGGPDNITVGIARVVGDADSTEMAGSNSPPGSSSLKQVPSMVWFVMLASIALLGAALLSEFGSQPLFFGLAGMGLVGLGASLAIAVFHVLSPSQARHTSPTLGPFGNGPYRTYDCKPDRPVADALAFHTQELRNLADQDDWLNDIDWSDHESHQTQATAAIEKKDFRAAITELCLAIRKTMQQIRERDQRRDYNSSLSTESTIELPDTDALTDNDGDQADAESDAKHHR